MCASVLLVRLHVQAILVPDSASAARWGALDDVVMVSTGLRRVIGRLRRVVCMCVCVGQRVGRYTGMNILMQPPFTALVPCRWHAE